MKHYIIRDIHTRQRVGYAKDEKSAQIIAKAQVKRFGTYLTVTCFDDSGKSWRENVVFSDNSCNWENDRRIGF